MPETVPPIGSRSRVDIPSDRRYATEADRELDEKLSEAIVAAEKVGNEYLATVLTHELGSHFFDNGKSQ